MSKLFVPNPIHPQMCCTRSTNPARDAMQCNAMRYVMYTRYTDRFSPSSPRTLTAQSKTHPIRPAPTQDPPIVLLPWFLSSVHSMAQIPPPLDQPPHQHLPPLLGPQAAQKPVSPLPDEVTRVVRVSGTAADLHACKGRRRADLGHDVERLCGGGESGAGCTRSGEGRGERRGGEHGAARAEEGYASASGGEGVSEVCPGEGEGGWRAYCVGMEGLRRVVGRATARRQRRAFIVRGVAIEMAAYARTHSCAAADEQSASGTGW